MTNDDFTNAISTIADLLESTRELTMKVNKVHGNQSLLPVRVIADAAKEIIKLLAFAVSTDFSMDKRSSPTIIFSDWNQDELGNPQQSTIRKQEQIDFPANSALSEILYTLSTEIVVWVTTLTRDLSSLYDLDDHVVAVRKAFERDKQNLMNDEASLLRQIEFFAAHNLALYNDLQVYRSDRRLYSDAIAWERKGAIKDRMTLQNLKHQNLHLKGALKKQFSAKRRKVKKL